MYPEIFQAGEQSDATDIKQNFGKKWGWFHTFMVYAGGDPLKLDEASKEPVKKVFHYIAYNSDLIKLQNTKQK